jgi:N-acetylmuramoyl-L-alanine amidase
MALISFRGSPHGGSHKLLPEWNRQPRITPTTIIDHSIVGSALGAWYYFHDSTGIESHFIVRGSRSGSADGHIWQLMDTGRQADANLNANAFAISIETEDNGDPDDFPWSRAQLESLRWLHAKLRAVHPTIPRRRCPSPRGGGLGYHSMWGAPSAWTPVAGKTCPGKPVRVRQWEQILLPAFLSPGGAIEEDDMPPYRQWDERDKQAMLDDIWRMVSQGMKVDGTKPSHVEDGSIGKLREIQNLHVYGDGIDKNLSNDTHATWSVMRLHERVRDLVQRLEEAGVIPRQPEA